MAGHSRPKDGVASARLCPAIHLLRKGLFAKLMDIRGSSPRMTNLYSFPENSVGVLPVTCRNAWENAGTLA
ncbi:MAG: hypothetical protein QOJ15_7178 [Bradyrhizobium sp.]|jgi:hypothetical protein|nr:hypothetical protein [Bradyrhizobium sp.]